jgi:carbamoyltransferase
MARQTGCGPVLGLSFGFHDSAAALVVDGEVVAACQEERFSRVKNDPSFPVRAIDFCLRQAGITPADLDLVAYHEQPLLKFDRIVKSWRDAGPQGDQHFQQTVARWIRSGQFDVAGLIAVRLGIARNRVCFTKHHLSHAASAFFCSGFERAAFVTIDGVGEYETASMGIVDCKGLREMAALELPHSLGLFYSAFTSFLGFQVNEGEYKVMGMAAFGRPRFKQELMQLFDLRGDGAFVLDQRLFQFGGMSDVAFSPAMTEQFGPPRAPDAPFDSASESCALYADLAASVQACTEEVVQHMALSVAQRTGVSDLVMAGGVALNSLANGKLLRSGHVNLYIQPAAGDAGCALGAAQYHWSNAAHSFAGQPLKSAALGRSFSVTQARQAAEESGYEILCDGSNLNAAIELAASLIAEGNVLGWLQGRSEWGPRALGCRSILADPRRADMQGLVNEKVKFREPFRPFAPAVPVEDAEAYFDFGARDRGALASPTAPEAFMLAVYPIKEGARVRLPAVTHVDGTARVQTVHRDHHPVFHALLRAFGDKSGIPVLLNTSFNLNGEPIVDSPADALKTFSLSGLDCLFMEGVILSKTFRGSL